MLVKPCLEFRGTKIAPVSRDLTQTVQLTPSEPDPYYSIPAACVAKVVIRTVQCCPMRIVT
jgi:hypothetical protein